jgi:hypothetical protein
MALGGRKAGGGWMARCPAHDDLTPSLSICATDDGKVLVHCHAGCGQEQVISILKSRGLWMSNGPRSHPTRQTNVQYKPDEDDAKRTEIALTIWQGTTPAGNTVVESYLASRGLTIMRRNFCELTTAGPVARLHVSCACHGSLDILFAILREGSSRHGCHDRRFVAFSSC